VKGLCGAADAAESEPEEGACLRRGGEEEGEDDEVSQDGHLRGRRIVLQRVGVGSTLGWLIVREGAKRGEPGGSERGTA
jgi:hypothetical protein